ncbi:MAG: cytochrome c biogenesis protein CcsA [Ignavibacteriales bacterium]|nr:cytochrome c biogenesis protein CcsA [Ignavibacteriales bacterium]
MIGTIFVRIAFAAALAAFLFYLRRQRGGNEKMLVFARASYHTAVVGLMLAFATLLYLILTHQFQYTYVWNYSSTDLPLPLLISTSYAGQEGSFMLWGLFTSMIGLFLLQYTSRKEYEPEVMSVYSLVLSFLLLMLIVKNPFLYIWDSFPADLVKSGPIPAGITNFTILDAGKNLWAQFPVEGKGLNPLLQNYWMVIHPQVLFLGFSSMTVPYALAIGGLLKRDYHSWIRVATPWSVFGAMVLGTGIILGGYWAYETLGWGGFWAWDPVENSSLIPWLLCVASIHTALTQRKSGAFVRTNFALSLSTFMMVLYSTFLTRSGVLGETSVHSFVDPGMWVYWLLLGCIVLFGAIGFGLLFLRMREMPKVPVEHSFFSREFALFLGAAALTFVSIFVVVGTSSPIITSLLKGKASAVDISYYVKTNLPLGIAITLLSGLGQLLWWKTSRATTLARRMAIPAVLSAATTSAVVLMGWEEPLILLFVFCSAFSLFANVQVGYTIYAGNPRYAGGALAHIGIAIMCIGFVTSERYDQKKTVSLEKGTPVAALGYQLTYVGYAPTPEGRYAFQVQVERNGRVRNVSPVMYFSNFTQSVMRHPDLINYLNRDFYVAPLSLEEASDGSSDQQIELAKSTATTIGNVQVTFEEFVIPDGARDAMMGGKPFELRARLSIREGKKKTDIDLLMKGGTSEGPTFVPVTYHSEQGGQYVLTLVRILPNEEDSSKSKVVISVKSSDQHAKPRPETLVIEASIKPFINLVWVGTVTLVIGFLITIFRRSQEARLKNNVDSD